MSKESNALQMFQRMDEQKGGSVHTEEVGNEQQTKTRDGDEGMTTTTAMDGVYTTNTTMMI